MIDRIAGVVLILTMLLVTYVEWLGARMVSHAAAICVLFFLILATPRVDWSRRVFVLVGLGLLGIAVATRPDWPEITEAGLRSAAFIAAFFVALTCLRSASATSPAVETTGRFLAEQPPGRRYLALTVGGHLFALMLNYGAISLLGTLAVASARREPNIEIRNHRIRRMLLAIQRGSVSTLSWSPLTFSIAVTTSIIPGSSWADAVAPCLVSSLILAGLGWTLDTIFKPRLSTPSPPRPKPTGSWTSLLPMLWLLIILGATVGGLHLLTGVRAIGTVMLVVPAMALAWIAMQYRGSGRLKHLQSRVSAYAAELFAYRSELVLLLMAGVIGTLGSRLISPLIAASGLDLAVLPAPLILVALVWLVPLAGLFGMNPILSVSLMAPLLPHAGAMGVTPTAIIVALTAGWALSGASSPYTATTMLVGAMANVSAWRVGLKWNGAYALLCGMALSAWVLIVAFALRHPA
jgi:hypothetical protein